MPDFASNPPPQENAVFGLGYARLTAIPAALALAEERAKESLLVQLRANVNTVIADYARSRNIGNSARNGFTESVERRLSTEVLAKRIPIRIFKSDDDSFWSIITYDKADAAYMIAAILEQEASDFPDFESMNAFFLVEQQLDRISTRPEVVGL